MEQLVWHEYRNVTMMTSNISVSKSRFARGTPSKHGWNAGTFRNVYNFVSQNTGGSGRIQVIAVAVQDTGAAEIGQEATARSMALASNETDQAPFVLPAAPAYSMPASQPSQLAGGYVGHASSMAAVQPSIRTRSEATGEVSRFSTECSSA